MKKIPFYLLFLFNTTLCLFAETTQDSTQDEGLTLWIALFGLGAVGLLSLFLSSEQLARFKKKTKDTQDDVSKMNQTQSQILSNMGEHIQNIAQETVDTAEKLVNNKEETNINQELSKVVNSEKKLLSITTNLIEFLRIKSKKIKIVNGKLKLSNLLNDVSGTLKANTKNIELELIYNIKSNIPENLMGDTLNISKVLLNTLLFCIENNTNEIEVKISKNTLLDTEENLYFTIKSGIKIGVDNDSLFNSNYNEETGTYDSLGLFIAKELAILMSGSLEAKNDKDGFLEFIFSVPFDNYKEIKQTVHKNAKKILIVDSSHNTATAIKNMLGELNHKPKIISKKDYLLKPPKFSDYDLVLIDEKLFTKNINQELKHSTSKVISLSNLFKIQKEFTNSAIAHVELNKPLTRNDLCETIEKLYTNKPQEITADKNLNTNNEKKLTVHTRTFDDSPNVDLNKFAEFRGTKILLVEDNLINQKVVKGVLSKSAIDITIANDGKEALDILHHSQKTFDIVFMDINMPIMDGYTATQFIRKENKFNYLPIIALSALASKSEVDKMFSSGMNGYLGKPLKKEKLFTVFTLYIQKKSVDRRAIKREEKNLQSLDGLNIFNGIAQSSSNEIFYKEILIEFKDAYGESAQVFENLVTDFRYEQLRMFCVDIRGLSGAIGAEDLHQLTTEILQRLVYKKYDLIPSFIERYTKELNKINKAIDAYID